MISSISSQSYSSYSIQKSYQAKETSLDKVSTSTYTNSTSFGFKTDDKGFIEPKLNEMAGIPTFIKIHTKTFDQITKYAHNTKSGLNPVQGLSKIWNFFSSAMGDSVSLNTNKTLNAEDWHKIPTDIAYDGTMFGNVIKRYYSYQEAKEITDLGQIYSQSNNTMIPGHMIFLNKNMDGLKGWYEASTGVKYDEQIPKDKVSVGTLFASLINREFMFRPDGIAKEVQNYYNFLKSGKSLEEYLKDTFGNDHIKGLKTRFSQHANNPKLARNLFDILLKELDKGSKNFYAQNIDFIQNHDMSDFKKFDNFKLDLKAGNILNLDV